ncbi:uncharacterized protein F5891DRAFT_505686 [Suillus fuscotomentosus]|uniref:Fungal-type protein kinase domain-containing protein n=1 Tax=Suillus fuscotomentosus TaxID=1912939 RepID=A0AAD4HHG8_9AGAM|nr:uncharacterized protein F5891DRAFT_505686 [Suillus fuscotomentosus]KAG1897795.1 hypothetical protein F5891DRAFT_505686 [Suillus fuscotomentosus]
MSNNASATTSVTTTPPRKSESGLPADLKSTPHAVGSAVVSEHIETVGVDVSDVRPWIARDVKNFKRCGADEMLQRLLEMCADPNQSLPPSQKSTLLDTSLEAVLHLCNGTGVAQKIKQHLTKFCTIENETPSYSEFVEAANLALRELRKVDVAGIPAFQNDDETNIVFHVNDPSFIHQKHQGEKSSRKPDIVVVSHQTAADIIPEGKSKNVYKSACKAPTKNHENFQWVNVRTTFEFKRPKPRLPLPPSAYTKDYVAPDVLYIEYMKETDASDSSSDSSSQSTDSSDLSTDSSDQLTDSSDQSMDSSDRSTDSTSTTGTAQSSHSNSNEAHRLRSNKRGSEHLRSNEPSTNKRSRQDEDRSSEQEERRNKKKKKGSYKPHPVIQNGLYVAEMFAAHTARQHVISFIVNNDIIYLWWFDRQHAIQCAGINFVQDLPRFVVLLFILQRMGYKQWGLHPLFEPEPGYKGKIIVEYEDDTDKDGQDKKGQDKRKRVDLTLDLRSEKRVTHFGLRGRATTVFPVTSKALSALPRRSHFRNKTNELVAKLFWPEEARQSEPEILEEVYKIAKDDLDVLGHVPEMVWFHKFEDTSTAIIRKALGIDDAGSRVLYIIVFKKLEPITTLSGEKFLLAWWQAVKCHRALWKRGVHHRDISPNNLMGYRLRGRFITVLNDFDLSSIEDLLSSIQGGPKGFERTGTVPFMALDLLKPEAIAGQVEHVYRHDAESFIWVLAWICLRYRKGKLLRKGRPLDEWLTVDAMGCLKEKSCFLTMLGTVRPTGSHEKSFKVAFDCLDTIIKSFISPTVPIPEDDEAFKILLQNHVPQKILRRKISL